MVYGRLTCRSAIEKIRKWPESAGWQSHIFWKHIHVGVAWLGAGTGPRYRARAGLFIPSGPGLGPLFPGRARGWQVRAGRFEIMHLVMVGLQFRGLIRDRGSLGSYNMFRVNGWNESTIKILGFYWFLTENSISGPGSEPGTGTGLGAPGRGLGRA